jgi:CobQ-like glutamine amidotransferase family enzyme
MYYNEISLAYLYPDLLSLHGDRGNIWAFEKVAANIGLSLHVSRIDSPEDAADLSAFDILFLSPGELSTARFLASALAPKRANFEEFLNSGKPMIIIGTTIAAFAGKTKRRDGTSFEGLGLVNASLTELESCYSNDAVLVCEVFGKPMEIVGGQIQIARVSLGGREQPLGRIEYGYGNDKGAYEGIRQKGLVYTNLLGPAFVKNPWFAEAILSYAAQQKGMEALPRMDEYDLERQSNEEIKRFVKMKIERYDKTRLDAGMP